MRYLSTRLEAARKSVVAAWRTRSDARRAGLLLLFGISYFAAYLYGNSLPRPAPLWPPDAVLLAALLLTSPRRWWVYVLVTVPIRLVPSLAPGVPFWLLLVNWANDTFKALLAAGLVNSFARGRPLFGSLRGCSVYVACAVVASPLLSAFVGAAGRVVIGGAFWPTWETWFLGDALANLVLVPAILLWARAGVRGLHASSAWRAGEALALGLALVLVSGWILAQAKGYLGDLTPHVSLYLYLVVPLFLWAAVRFGPRGLASALASFTLLVMTGLADTKGLFTLRSPTAEVLDFQLFLLTVGVPFLFLATLMRERTQALTALQASEVRYRTVVETQTELITRYQPDTTLTFVNDAVCRFQGQAREALLGTSMLAPLPAEAAARVRALVDTLLAEPEPGIVTIEHETRYQDGSLRWQEWVNRTIRDAGGQVIELQGIGRDITERKQMEREQTRLLESERATRRQLETVLDVLPAAVAIADAHGKLLQVNQAFRATIGRPSGCQPRQHRGVPPLPGLASGRAPDGDGGLGADAGAAAGRAGARPGGGDRGVRRRAQDDPQPRGARLGRCGAPHRRCGGLCGHQRAQSPGA
jgi:PAS domain S-box-containing protein